MKRIKDYFNDFMGGLNCKFRNKHEFENFNGYGYRCKHCFRTMKMVRDGVSGYKQK